MTDDSILNPRGYELLNLIGEGAYSKVRSAYSTNLRHNCAIKCIDKRNAPDDFVQKFLPRELEILPKLNHKNIIKVLRQKRRILRFDFFGKKFDF